MPEIIYPISEDQQPSLSLVEAVLSFARFDTDDINTQAQNNRLLMAVELQHLTPSLVRRFCEHRKIETISLTYQPSARVYDITLGQPPETVRVTVILTQTT